MSSSPLLTQLIDHLRCLPGVGTKTAQRMAFYLLERDREGARKLAQSITEAITRIGHCKKCRTFSETELCATCANGKRDASTLCVVEGPADQMALEQSTGYRGLYFVLMGRLSPLDGIGPAELGLDQLAQRLDGGGIDEVILATSSTVEGETTAHFIANLAARRGIKVTRLASGVPVGGELEYLDSSTLSHAFAGRHSV